MPITVTVEQAVTFCVLGVGLVGSYWKLKSCIKENKHDIKEAVKGLDDVDEAIAGIVKTSMTKEAHGVLCENATLKIKEIIRDTTDEVKQHVDETMLTFQEKFGKMFEELGKKIEENGRPQS